MEPFLASELGNIWSWGMSASRESRGLAAGGTPRAGRRGLQGFVFFLFFKGLGKGRASMHWDMECDHTPSSRHRGHMGCWNSVSWTQCHSDQCHLDIQPHSTGTSCTAA